VALKWVGEPMAESDSNVSSALFRRRLAEFTPGDYHNGRSIAWRVAWFATQNMLFDRWWFPSSWRPFLLRRFGAKVGRGCLIRHGVRIHWPWNLELGNDVWIGEFAWLHSLVDIVVEDDVCISQHAAVVTGGHHHRDPRFSYDNGPVLLRSGCWIAARATVLRGVTIGRNSVVGTGAVASRDLGDNMTLTSAAPRERHIH
jgi:putative colanic acid biosynthesis acetyltransferase WcaF